MEEQVLQLSYPTALVRKPIISELIRTYSNLQVNILRAEVTPDSGWLEIQLVGQPAVIEDAISWLQEKGIQVQTLGA